MNHNIKLKKFDTNIIKTPIITIVKTCKETSSVLYSDEPQSLSHYNDRENFYKLVYLYYYD